jgi:hypothetical protein
MRWLATGSAEEQNVKCKMQIEKCKVNARPVLHFTLYILHFTLIPVALALRDHQLPTGRGPWA